MAHTVRIGLLDIRDEIAGIRQLTEQADLASFAANWAMKRAVQHALLHHRRSRKAHSRRHEGQPA